MRVRCIATEVSDGLREQLGPHFDPNQSFGLGRGKEYDVIGLLAAFNTKFWGAGVWCKIINDVDYRLYPMTLAPLGLFVVVDPRASRYWEMRVQDDGTAVFMPPSLHRDFYDDDLVEEVPEVVADFSRVRHLIEAEFETTRRNITADL